MKNLTLYILVLFSLNGFSMAKKPQEVPTKRESVFKKKPINQLNFVPITSKLLDEKTKDNLTKSVIRNIVQNSNYQLNIGQIESHQSQIPVYKISLEVQKVNQLFILTARITDPVNKALVKKAFNKGVGYNSLTKSTDELVRRLLENKTIMEHNLK